MRGRTEYPQPAFNVMDAADAFWAARITSRFTNDMIKAIVDTGELSDPDDAKYLTDVIIKRRDKVVAYWIGRTNPLDSFALNRNAAGLELAFDNAAIRLRVVGPGATYRARWLAFDNATGSALLVGQDLDLSQTRVAVPNDAWGPADIAGRRYASVSISTVEANHPNWAVPVLVTLRERGGAIDIVGIERSTVGERAR